MGMYNYISDIETKFIEVEVPKIIKDCDEIVGATLIDWCLFAP